MPLSLFTIAKSGPFSNADLISASISLRFASGKSSRLSNTSPNPLFASTPISSKVSAYLSKTDLKNVLTA